MIGFKIVNLDLLLQVKSEEQIRTILNDFESPLNPDIESFLNLNCNMKLNSIQIYNFINFFKKNIQRGSII